MDTPNYFNFLYIYIQLVYTNVSYILQRIDF